MKEINLTELFQRARTKGWTPAQLGHWLTGAPHNLTPADATRYMDGYRKYVPLWGTPMTRKPGAHPMSPSMPRPPKPVSSKDVILNEGGPPEHQVLPCPETPAPGSLSVINRSAVKNYALKVSTQLRAGKFTRVSSEFLDGVQATLESVIRGLAQSGGDDVTPDAEADWFINGRTVRMAEEQLNAAVRAIVAGKVRRHPSVGCTLK